MDLHNQTPCDYDNIAFESDGYLSRLATLNGSKFNTHFAFHKINFRKPKTFLQNVKNLQIQFVL